MSQIGDCAFCALVRAEPAPEREVWRGDDTLVFFPDEPVAVGHTLVIPTTHAARIWDLSDAVISALARTVARAARAIEEQFAPDGLNVIQSNGRAASQTVDHVHFHLVPRTDGDAMGDIWPRDVEQSANALDDARRLLHQQMNGSN